MIAISLVGAYIFSPAVQQFLKEGYKILSSGDEQQITEWVGQTGYWGPLFIILAMVIQMFTIVINVVLLMLVAILAYGPLAGLIDCHYRHFHGFYDRVLYRRLFGPGIVDKILGRGTKNKVQDKVQKYGYWAVVLARISPWLSNDAISFVAGLLGMRYWKFMGATLLGILPLTILIAWLGEDWDRLKPGLIWISVISIVAFIGYLIYKK